MLTTTERESTPILIVRDAWLLDLGRKPYREVWELQKALVDRRAEDKIPDGLMLVEHNPVATVRPRRRNHDIHGEAPRAFRRLGRRQGLRHRPLPGGVRRHVPSSEPQRAVAGTAARTSVAPLLSALTWRIISGMTSNRFPTI